MPRFVERNWLWQPQRVVMLIECQNCGAPLKVKARDRTARCAYCGRDNYVQSTRTIAQQTPPGWRPPQQWLPPPQFPAPSVHIQLNPALARRGSAGCSVLVALLGVLVAGGVAFGVMAFAGGSGGGLPWDKTASWDGKSTLRCEVNGQLTIENKIANVATGPVISAGTNCRITVINSTLSGQTGIDGGMNVTIEMRRSRIEATQRGVSCGVNCKVSMREQSRISGKEHGVYGDANLKVEVRDSAVVSQEVAIHGGPVTNVTGHGCDLQGPTFAIQGGHASKVDLVGCKVKGPKELLSGSTISER